MVLRVKVVGVVKVVIKKVFVVVIKFIINGVFKKCKVDMVDEYDIENVDLVFKINGC